MEEIAEICEWVPENPARTFREALQAQWWGQIFNRIEQTSSALGQGRMDQYLLPYYEKDIAEGRITKESATELFHCLWIEYVAGRGTQTQPGGCRRHGRVRSVLEMSA